MKAKPTSLLLFTLLGLLPSGFAAFHFTKEEKAKTINRSRETKRSTNAIVKITAGASAYSVITAGKTHESAAVALLNSQRDAQEKSIASAEAIQKQEAANQEQPKQKLKQTIDQLTAQFPPPSKEEVMKKVATISPFLPNLKPTEAELAKLGSTASSKTMETLKGRASRLGALAQSLSTLAQKKKQLSPATLAEKALKQ